MKTHSELKLFKSGSYEYIYIYFKLGGSTIRINTNNKYVKHLTKKDLTYNSSMENHRELNESTTELKRRVDDYIREKLSAPFPKVNQKECKEYIDDKNYFITSIGAPRFIRINSPEKISQQKSVLELLEDFLQEKKQELNYNYHSYKKYITLKNGLTEFGKQRNVSLTLEAMNNKIFIYDFRDFLFGIGYNDNAANMRVKNLKTFFRYLEENEVYNFKKAVYDTKIGTYENDVVTLSIEELKSLLELKIEKVQWQRIIDLFVCNSFMGLRHGDLNTLELGQFKKDSV